MKTCTRCNVKKDLSEFNKDKKNKDGLNSHCKECRKRGVNYKYSLKNCDYCNKQYKPRSLTTRYCSEKCQINYKLQKHKDKLQERLKDKSCIFCNKNFKPTRFNNIFCSRRCCYIYCGRRHHQIHRPKIKNKVCGICKKTYKPRTNQGRYCSKDCARIATNKRAWLLRPIRHAIMKPCEECGKKFKKINNTKRFCSKKCYTIGTIQERRVKRREYYQTKGGKLVRMSGRHKRRAKLHEVIHSFTEKEWIIKVKRTKGICPICNNPFSKPPNYKHILTMDHTLALDNVSKGFIYTIKDVRPICGSCNSRKGNR